MIRKVVVWGGGRVVVIVFGGEEGCMGSRRSGVKQDAEEETDRGRRS